MIKKAASVDIDVIFELYDLATAYQKTKADKTWTGFKKELINNEISEGRLWKIIIDHEIACIFSIDFSDPLIWGPKDADPAIYLHRIATNPKFRGKGFVRYIIEWAIHYGKIHEKKFIRLDTFGDNEGLIDYYQKCGFTFLGLSTPKSTNNLPAHYEGVSLSLFELEVV